MKHEENEKKLKRYEFKIKQHIFARFQTSLMLIKRFMKSFQKTIITKAFKSMMIYNKNKLKNLGNPSINEKPQNNSKIHNFISSGLTEKNV